jgi:hypothetical protein
MLSEVGAHATTKSKHPGAVGCHNANTGRSTEIAHSDTLLRKQREPAENSLNLRFSQPDSRDVSTPRRGLPRVSPLNMTDAEVLDRSTNPSKNKVHPYHVEIGPRHYRSAIVMLAEIGAHYRLPPVMLSEVGTHVTTAVETSFCRRRHSLSLITSKPKRRRCETA